MSVTDINPNLIANTASIIDVKASPSESAQSLGKIGVGVGAVSYTHLDVYKRQDLWCDNHTISFKIKCR